MKNKSYFYGKVPMKADIARHRAEELDLRKRIEELEKSNPIEHDWNMEWRDLCTYRAFLIKLLDSKAEVTSKIGKVKQL